MEIDTVHDAYFLIIKYLKRMASKNVEILNDAGVKTDLKLQVLWNC